MGIFEFWLKTPPNCKSCSKNGQNHQFALLSFTFHKKYHYIFRPYFFFNFKLSSTMQSGESEINRATAALSWSNLLSTLHSLLTSHDRRDEHSWKKTALNKTGYWDTAYWATGYWDNCYWDTGYWDTGYWDIGYWDTRHCKHLQQSQSHSIELIFVPWLERIFWINFDTKSTLLKIYSFENIFKKLLFVIIVFSFRKLLVSKNYKMLAFLTEVKKGSSTLP